MIRKVGKADPKRVVLVRQRSPSGLNKVVFPMFDVLEVIPPTGSWSR